MMFRKRNLVVVLLLAAMAWNPLAAQDNEWTLEECINYALENNITLKRQELTTTSAQKDLTQSKLNALPNLNAQAVHNLAAGRILDEGTYEWVNTDIRQGNLGLAANFTIFSGFQGYNSMKMSEIIYKSSIETMRYMENNVVLNIMTGYLELLRREELYGIAIEKVKLTDLQVERMQKLLDVGNASSGELLEVKAQASKEKYNMTVARTQANAARLELLQMMNLNEMEEFEIIRPRIQDPNLLKVPALAEVYNAAVTILPEVKSAEYNIEASEKGLAIARGGLSPEIFAQAYYRSNYNNLLPNPLNAGDPYPYSQQLVDNQYQQLSVGVTIPIFNRWQSRTQISKAKIDLEDSRLLLDDVKQKLFKEIQQYYAEALGAYDNYMAASESYANSEEAYRFAEEKFKVGNATTLELAEARNRLFESQGNMVTTRYVFVFYLKILDFYQGKDIFFEGQN